MVLDNIVDYNQIFLKKDLSYRYYKYLSEKDKARFDKSNLNPEQKLMALKIHRLYYIPFRKALRLAKEVQASYLEWLPTRKLLIKKPSKPEHIAKEFAFRGFKRIEDYPVNDDRYTYIMSSDTFPKEFGTWVYPRKFIISYNQMQQKIKRGLSVADYYIYPNFENIGIREHTKIKYCKL